MVYMSAVPIARMLISNMGYPLECEKSLHERVKSHYHNLDIKTETAYILNLLSSCGQFSSSFGMIQYIL